MSAASRSVSRNRRFFGSTGALEHVIDDFLAAAARLLLIARMADAEAQPPELRPDVLDDAADAVVPGAAAVEPKLHAARRQVELVVGDEHVLGRDLVVVRRPRRRLGRSSSCRSSASTNECADPQ